VNAAAAILDGAVLQRRVAVQVATICQAAGTFCATAAIRWIVSAVQIADHAVGAAVCLFCAIVFSEQDLRFGMMRCGLWFEIPRCDMGISDGLLVMVPEAVLMVFSELAVTAAAEV
jgi:hypothetical protein